MTSLKFVKTVVENVIKRLYDQKKKIPSKAVTPMTHNYTPEVDSSSDLNNDDVTTFQESFGVYDGL